MRALAALLGLWPLAAVAQPLDSAALGGSPEARVRLDAIRGDLEQSFERLVARYDEEIAAQPFRIRARIERCNFIESFPLEFESLAFDDAIYERSEQCEQELAAEFPDHPEVRLRQLERTYGDEQRLQAGQELLTLVDAQNWTAGQRARLYTDLANASNRLDPERRFRERTARYARLALEHDVRADVRLVLAEYFQEAGDRAAALEALTSPFDGHAPEDQWYIARKMARLAELGARDAVLALHATLDDTGYYDRTEVAAALRAVGELELAERELGEEGAGAYGSFAARQRFLLALDGGDAEAAYTAYQAWRDLGYWEDPIGINRFALLVAHPGLPWQARDALGFLGALAFLALWLALWWVPLALVHYRGLANRERAAMPPSPSQGFGLRAAWLGLATLSVSQFVAMYTIGPFDAFTDPTQWWAIVAEQSQLADLLVVGTWLGIVLLAGVAYILRGHFGRWWATDWSIGKCLAVGVLAGLAFRVPMLLVMAVGYDLDTAMRVSNVMWQTLVAVDETYGSPTPLWLVTIAAPAGEELVFRGLLLRACLRHVSFPVANGVQALLFAALHLDLAAMPFLFAFGLGAGALAKRSGGLLAPMVMHAVFNLVAGILLTTS